jgi:AraC family transcriptional regulator, transcriptional activator of pobA
MPRLVTQDIDIPKFFLFGESPQAVGDHYLHLEALSDRSRPNNWNIRTHAHAGLSHIFHISSGAGVMRAEERAYSFAAPCALLVPAGVAHGFQFQPETEGRVLTISHPYLQELALRERCFLSLFDAPAALALSPGSLDAAFDALSRELNWVAAGHGAAVEAHLLCVLVACARALEQANIIGEAAGPGPQATMVARFREAIERHYRDGLPLARYTAMLGVSEKQLRAACRKCAHQTPTRMIEQRILLEAKRALLYSNMRVAEAAYYLGFNDPAYFSRFFAKAAGKSPRAFRKEKS